MEVEDFLALPLQNPTYLFLGAILCQEWDKDLANGFGHSRILSRGQ
jgi:hypothetical protein